MGTGTEDTEYVVRRLLGGLRLALVVTVTTIHCGLALPTLLAHQDEYATPVLHFTLFGALTVLLAGCITLLLRGTALPRMVWLGGALGVLVAGGMVTHDLAVAQIVDSADWLFLAAGWYGLLLLLDVRLRYLVCFFAAHATLVLARLLVAGMPSAAEVAEKATRALIVYGFQLTMVAAVVLLRRSARQAGAAIAERERVLTGEAVAGRIHRDRQEHYARLGESVLPLLGGLSDGTLDPADEAVKAGCAFEAARMRRLFAENDQADDQLLHELRACIDLAERGGVLVQLAVRGQGRPLPVEVRRALTDPILAALATTRHAARVTLLYGDRVRVSVVTDRPGAEPPRPAHPEVRLHTLADDTRFWVEASCAVHSSSSPISPS
ncbi:hypothetical protein [Amycolatopsis aidingensis]|uniref:hypothetical protein n=1 Tax=Amycolatopsis aidingensis TaxID=2842453 RepID=UPI001C0B1AEC|nr:hypothetical protein [Amycolatopsis aidingensis]